MGRAPQEFVKIVSHPQAIAQCQFTLRNQFPNAELRFADSTAQAARLIKENSDEIWLAIGTRRAAELNGLAVLQENIQDHPNNLTRFLALGRKPKKQCKDAAAPCKTSLQVTLPSDYPGALYQVLAAFSWRKINLCRIESRPTKTGLGNYYFLIDAELPADHLLMKGALSEVEALGCQVRVLGSFPCYYKEWGKIFAVNTKKSQND
jgi:prephenate dehydratase